MVEIGVDGSVVHVSLLRLSLSVREIQSRETSVRYRPGTAARETMTEVTTIRYEVLARLPSPPSHAPLLPCSGM